MNNVSLVVLALLVVGTAMECSASRHVCDMRSGKLSVNFNCGGDGLSVWYDDVCIIKESSMWLHNSAWNKHYYGLPQMSDDVIVRDIEGGKEAVIPHKSEFFDGSQTIKVTADKVSVDFKGRLIKDIADADMEYCFGKFCAAPILGRPYSGETIAGKIENGIAPIRATNISSWSQQLTSEAFKKLEIDTRVGRMTLDVSGHPASLIMMDYRANPYHAIDEVPYFWCGTSWHFEYGKEYAGNVTITMKPHARAAAPKPTAIPVRIVQDKDQRLAQYGPVYVIPEPQEMKLTEGAFRLTRDTRIVVADAAKRADLRGANSFADEVDLLYGFRPKVVREREAGKNPAILVGEAANNKLLAATANKKGLTAPSKDEGYALSATPSQVLVMGYDQRGSFYGMQTLKQLLVSDAKGAAIQSCEINDWPSLPFRGVHIFTSNEALPFHKKLIDRILARYKMNNIIMEAEFVKWEADPSIAVPWAQDQSEIKEEIKYAKENFIEINPLMQSLGHCDWLFLMGKNKDIAENPGNPYAYCPTNPRTYPYIFKFYDELIKLFDNPRYVHIGHDEVSETWGFPLDEECKKIGGQQLFLDDTLKVYDHIRKAGPKVMMWGDMLLSRGDSPDATHAPNEKAAKWLRDNLPKDIVITDWHYAAAKPEEFKSLKLFMDEGFEVIAATWDTPANIEDFAQQAKNVGAMGLLQTTWAGFKSAESNIKENFKQFSAFILAAEYAWNNGKTNLDHLPYSADEEFRRQWTPKSIAAIDQAGFSVDLSKVYNTSLADNDKLTGWFGLGAQHDMSAVPTGPTRFRGDLFNLAADNKKPSAVRLASSLDDTPYPKSVKLAIGRKADSLMFLHTCGWTDKNNRKVGSYKINYADGSSETIDLQYGANIVSWLDQRSIGGAEKMWGGRTKDDQRVSLWRLQWDNPKPEKVIESIELNSAGTEAGPVILGLSALQKKQ